MRIRTLIADDEPLARRGLELRLARHPDVEIVAQAGNGREALAGVAALAPDLMLLDVQMPEVDGFAVLRALPLSAMPLTVFVTAYDQYALQAFQASAIDYLLKPIEDERLDQALARVRVQLAQRTAHRQRGQLLELLARLSGPGPEALGRTLEQGDGGPAPRDTLAIRDGARILRVKCEHILWIDAAGDYMCVHVADQTHVLRATMRALERRLDPARFQRIHRSAIVNLERVSELRSHLNGEYFVTLDSGHTLKLSRSYKDKIKLLR
jgi:two-component system LytT family response regulator